jgi:hypothetical protein
MTTLSIPIKKVEYKITFSNTNNPILGQTDTKNMDSDISIEIADTMVYKRNVRFNSFSEYMKSETPDIVVEVMITINNIRKIYTINENLLMYIYGCKFDEYYVESEYEISDWAISSPSSSTSSLEYEF